MSSPKDFAEILLDIKAVMVRLNPPFTWSSGMKRPIYADHRMVISYPEYRKKIVLGFKELIEKHNLKFDVIGGTATAAVPWASFLAYELNVPMVYIKKETKGYGTDKRVEGHMEKGSKVLIIEDLISTGGSSIRAAEACKNEFDAHTVAVLAIFTYEMIEAKESFESAPFNLHTLSNFHTLIDVATEQNYLSKTDREEILRWSVDPKKWHDEYISKNL